VKSLSYYGTVTKIIPESIAEEVGIEAGDRLLKVNGEELRDLIDLSFALADDYVELLIEKANGDQEIIEVEKEYDEDLGIEFESAVFDGIRRCANKCIFCFVDQMAPNMRESLYVKDDDYRMSFLYGNFVTLTNLVEQDFDRIRQLHLSPLYISVHTTDGPLRSKMLHNKKAAHIMDQITRLTDNGIELHTQVVLCPNINDGVVLEKTIEDLYQLYPSIQSLAIVPVGLSRYRNDCYPLEGFTSEQAYHIISMVTKWQEKSRLKHEVSFVYLSDEFYIAANQPIPSYEHYDEFPQLENGIGLVRNFLTEWESSSQIATDYSAPTYIDIVCGRSAEKILKPLLNELVIPNLYIRIVPIENRFFGSDITVTGLLTGQDIVTGLSSLSGERTGIIIPGIALRKGEDVFLDDSKWQDIEKQLNIPVRVAYSAADLKRLLYQWS
jgi:putative radical SAM enzyme (TIGR03279 family)